MDNKKSENLYWIYEEDNEGACALVASFITKEEANRKIRDLMKQNPNKKYGILKCIYPYY